MILNECHILFHGPSWLESQLIQETDEIPPECMEELRVDRGAAHSVIENRERNVINCRAYVLSFICRLKGVLKLKLRSFGFVKYRIIVLRMNRKLSL